MNLPLNNKKVRSNSHLFCWYISVNVVLILFLNPQNIAYNHQNNGNGDEA